VLKIRKISIAKHKQTRQKKTIWRNLWTNAK